MKPRKAPVVGMSCGQFRHGPIEVVTEKFRCILIAAEGDTFNLDVVLANNLTAMGAQLLWIGPEPSDKDEISLARSVERMLPWPEDLPTWLAPIFEIIPLQLAAYELALLRGVRPGDFRYTPEGDYF